jgi:hypothetical protein
MISLNSYLEFRLMIRLYQIKKKQIDKWTSKGYVNLKQRVSICKKFTSSVKIFLHKGDLKLSDLEKKLPVIETLEPYPKEEFTRCSSIGIVSAYQRYDAEAVVRLILDLPPFHEFFSVMPYKTNEKDYIKWFIRAQRARYES